MGRLHLSLLLVLLAALLLSGGCDLFGGPDEPGDTSQNPVQITVDGDAASEAQLQAGESPEYYFASNPAYTYSVIVTVASGNATVGLWHRDDPDRSGDALMSTTVTTSTPVGVIFLEVPDGNDYSLTVSTVEATSDFEISVISVSPTELQVNTSNPLATIGSSGRAIYTLDASYLADYQIGFTSSGGNLDVYVSDVPPGMPGNAFYGSSTGSMSPTIDLPGDAGVYASRLVYVTVSGAAGTGITPSVVTTAGNLELDFSAITLGTGFDIQAHLYDDAGHLSQATGGEAGPHLMSPLTGLLSGTYKLYVTVNNPPTHGYYADLDISDYTLIELTDGDLQSTVSADITVTGSSVPDNSELFVVWYISSSTSDPWRQYMVAIDESRAQSGADTLFSGGAVTTGQSALIVPGVYSVMAVASTTTGSSPDFILDYVINGGSLASGDYVATEHNITISADGAYTMTVPFTVVP